MPVIALSAIIRLVFRPAAGDAGRHDRATAESDARRIAAKSCPRAPPAVRLVPTPAGAAALAAAQAFAGRATAPPPCAPTRPTGRIMPPGAPRTVSSLCRPRRPRSAPISPAWRKATPRAPSAGGCRRSAKCIASTTCRGTRPSRHPGPAAGIAAHATAARPARPRRCRSPCSASCWPPATRANAAGATARCCCSASPARCAAPNWFPACRGCRRGRRRAAAAHRRGKTDQAGQGAEIGLPRGKHAETCPVRAFEAWQAVAKRRAGPLFRRISTGDRIGAERAASRRRAAASWRTASAWPGSASTGSIG